MFLEQAFTQLLPNEEKEKRKSEIEKLDKETIELQTQYFGVNGEYFLKRQEFIQPIQDRVCFCI